MNRKKIWLILGPALFALSFIPYGGLTQNVRLALGTVLWMGVWWVAMPVPPAITAFLPVVINAVFALTDMSSITNCYSAELVFLLAGADIITMVWEITGVDKRIAAHSLALVGTSVRQQVVIWFLISTVLSAVLPNTVVAAVLCSIAMAMLKFVGEGDVGKSSAAKLVLLAIVWGANNGHVHAARRRYEPDHGLVCRGADGRGVFVHRLGAGALAVRIGGNGADACIFAAAALQKENA